MLDRVDPWTIVTVGLVVAFLLLLRLTVRDRRTLGRIHAAAGAARTVDLTKVVSNLRVQIDTVERTMAEERRDRDTLVDSMGLGILLLDEQSRVVQANAAAHAFAASAPGALLGRTIMEVFLDRQIEALAVTALEIGSASGEVRAGDADGPRVIVRARRSAAGGVWMTLEDVSELRRLQQIRAEFIDNLSHELRTPLTTVSLLAETLTREADAAGDAIPAKMRDRIGKIEVETGHLVQMVNEILDLSRIESGRSLGVLDLLDLGQVAVASTERLRLFAERQGVALGVEIAEDLPLVRGDEDRLGQVLVNLLHNAVKFSPDGGEVTVRVRSDGAEVMTSVQDHGIGVPRAAQARIFERFYKVDRARVRGETSGTGLGLAIARHVIEQHGGRIWVESQEGQGSTFSFALPLPATDDQP
jgi:two-component system, OmpR family, phosphate regulon sensor histidine kinase PhoR